MDETKIRGLIKMEHEEVKMEDGGEEDSVRVKVEEEEEEKEGVSSNDF